MSAGTLPSFDPRDPLGLDDLLDPEDLAVRDTMRQWAADRVLPHVADWFERGEVPGIRELARELGSLGALGMSLTGYGCAGASPVQYGLACLELEAADSGIRSLMSVQGSLSMYAIHRFGSEEQKQQWLPRMASGEVIGCFGLTEPDHGSDPAGMRTYAKRDGSDWVLTGRKMWITNGSVAGVAVVWARTDEGIRGFVVPTDAPGFSAPDIKHKWSLRASVTSELVLDEVRPVGRRGPARGHRLAGAAELSGPRPLRHHLGLDGGRPLRLRGGAGLRARPRAVRPSRSGASSSPRPSWPIWRWNSTRGSCSPTIWGGAWRRGGSAPSRSASAS